MSWCVMQESIVMLKADMDVIFDRTGGRGTGENKPEPFITMSQCQVPTAHLPTRVCLQRIVDYLVN